jgi:GIY-YIG catalytic domain
MTKKDINYSDTVIYKIICNDTNITDVYVGSTTNFIKRKCLHKCACNTMKNKAYNTKLYQSIRYNGGWENWAMLEVEKYPCKDGNEARARERVMYDQLNASLNTIRPSISALEEKQQNKKDSLNEKQTHITAYIRYIKDIIQNYSRFNKPDRLLKMNPHQYSYKNYNGYLDMQLKKDNEYITLDEYNHILDLLEKELSERLSNKPPKLLNPNATPCSCGGSFTTKGQSRHLKTVKHQEFMMKTTEEPSN